MAVHHQARLFVRRGTQEGGYSEGTVGAVQTFFLRADAGPWTNQRLAALAPVDVVLRLSHERAKAKVYPCIDVLASRSRLLDQNAVSKEHAEIAKRVREALTALWSSDGCSSLCADARERALNSKIILPSHLALHNPTPVVPEQPSVQGTRCRPARTSLTVNSTIYRSRRSTLAGPWTGSEQTLDGSLSSVQWRYELRTAMPRSDSSGCATLGGICESRARNDDAAKIRTYR